MFGKHRYGLKPPLEHSDLPKYVYTTRVTKLTRCHICPFKGVCTYNQVDKADGYSKEAETISSPN